jgi:type I restriction enzyme, S subunit
MVNLGCFLGHGRFSTEAFKHYTGDFQPRHTVQPGDLVLANTDITQKREVIGSPGIVPPVHSRDKLIFTHHVFAARFHKDQEDRKLFVYFTLLREEFRERATGFAIGTTVLALPRDAVLNYRFAQPPEPAIAAFNRFVTPLIERQWQGNAESRTIATVRDTLLPKLISGALKVKDAERLIERATP